MHKHYQVDSFLCDVVLETQKCPVTNSPTVPGVIVSILFLSY